MTTTVTALAQDIGLARETDCFLMKDQLTEDELGLLPRGQASPRRPRHSAEPLHAPAASRRRQLSS